MSFQASLNSRSFLVLPLLVFLFILMFLYREGLVRSRLPTLLHQHDNACPNHLSTPKIAVILKTGASEIEARLPVHLETILNCPTHHLIFSDLRQTFLQGNEKLEIHDALSEVSQHVAGNSTALKYWKSLQQSHNEGRNLTGKETTKAWDLDRYKNIPMLRKAYTMLPEEIEWFVFMDADTSILWSSLLHYVSLLPRNTPLYIGAQNLWGNSEFAHGGSGYLVSRSAAKLLADDTERESDLYWRFATDACCGDVAVGLALKDKHVTLTKGWPNWQGETVKTLDFRKEIWCFWVVSWHHLDVKEVIEMWEYERGMRKLGKIPTYAQIFNDLVLPHLNSSLAYWDNLSQDKHYNTNDRIYTASGEHITSSFKTCQQACLASKEECFQFKWKPGKCSLGFSIKLGKRDHFDTWTSGWDMGKIEKLMERKCTGVRWSLPEK